MVINERVSSSGEPLLAPPLLSRELYVGISYGNGVPSPVLKHGPRSQTDAQGRRYSFPVLLSY